MILGRHVLMALFLNLQVESYSLWCVEWYVSYHIYIMHHGTTQIKLWWLRAWDLDEHVLVINGGMCLYNSNVSDYVKGFHNPHERTSIAFQV